MIKNILIGLLVIAIILFVSFPIVKRVLLKNNFKEIYRHKIEAYCKCKRIKSVSHIHLVGYGEEETYVDHIIYGKKYIYLINDFYLPGIVAGKEKDNSWIYINKSEKVSSYIENLLNKSSQTISEISKLLKIDKSLFVSVALISNETDLRIDENNRKNCLLVKSFKLLKKIEEFEHSDIKNINEEQLKIVIEEINGKNKTRKEQ